MSYFPFFMEIGQKPCLVVGGGTVALRKIERLLPFGASITVVAPVFCREIAEMTSISRICRPFAPADIEGMSFVIGATDNAAVNREISAVCRAKSIPVNIVDDPKSCTFLFPALVKRGELVAGISTGGGSPLAAQFIRKRVEEAIPPGFADVVAQMAALRERILREILDSAAREALLRELFALALDGQKDLQQETERRLREYE